MPDPRQKITFGEMRASGVRGLLIYCRDHRCSHLDRDQRRPMAGSKGSSTGCGLLCEPYAHKRQFIALAARRARATLFGTLVA